MATTTNRLIRIPVGTDVPDVPTDLTELGQDIDNMTNGFSGVLAARPAASSAAGHASGSPWSFFYATDTKQVFLSVGGAWVDLGAGPPVPIGGSIEWAGNGDPTDTRWRLEDGRALSRTTFASLFTELGTTYGSGDGSTTFNIPDSRGRVSVAPDNMGTAAGAAGRLPNSPNGRGNVGGEERHTLIEAEGPAGWVGDQRGSNIGTLALSLGDGFYHLDVNAGGSPHNNLQPYVVKNKIIRVS
jgi:microcystin-dependent protein